MQKIKHNKKINRLAAYIQETAGKTIEVPSYHIRRGYLRQTTAFPALMHPVIWDVNADNEKMLRNDSTLGILLSVDADVWTTIDTEETRLADTLSNSRRNTRTLECLRDYLDSKLEALTDKYGIRAKDKAVNIKMAMEVGNTELSDATQRFFHLLKARKAITRFIDKGLTMSQIQEWGRFRRSYNSIRAEIARGARSIDLQLDTRGSEKLEHFKASWNTMEPNSVKEAFLPKGSAIGIEIEFLARAREYTSDGDTRYDTSETSFVKPAIHGVSWGYDTSVKTTRDYHYATGQEVRVMLRQGNWKRLEKVLTHLKTSGCEVNHSCGLHVHLDCRDLSHFATVTRGKRLESALSWLREMVPAGRSTRGYAKPKFSTSDKYAAITMHQYSYGRKAIEVRLHSSSFNLTKIKNWINLLLFIKDNYKHLHTWEDFINSTAPMDLKVWAIRRREKFKPSEIIQEGADPDADTESEQISEIECHRDDTQDDS
jgi:hypothetical protein